MTITLSLSQHSPDFHGGQALALEKALMESPRRLIVKFVGEQVAPTASLLYDDILSRKSPQTTLIGCAYNRLLAADFLPWLRCDKRQIIPSGYAYIPNSPREQERDSNGGTAVKLAISEALFYRDYEDVLRRISAFPQMHLAGDYTDQLLTTAWLSEFGLIGPSIKIDDNENQITHSETTHASPTLEEETGDPDAREEAAETPERENHEQKNNTRKNPPDDQTRLPF